MSDYFSYFPLMQYDGKLCRSIISRAALSQEMIKRTTVFYPYTNKFNERADTLSFHYYDTPNLDWLVYYANDVIDPYYGWYLSEDQFVQMLADKYGSVYETQMRIHHFQVDWVGDDRQLTLAAYDALPGLAPTNVKQYWQPVLNDVGATIYYVRKKMDTTVTTNRIVRVELPSTAGYQEGELVSQFNNGVLSGYAEITTIETNALTLQHIVGDITIGYPLTGFASEVAQTPTTVSTLKQNIPAAEMVYWRGITIYEYEDFLNEQRKILRVVDKRHADRATSSLASVFG